MEGIPKKLSFRLFLTLGPYEEDEGFKELLRSIAVKGMLVGGILAIVSTSVFIFGHIFIIGKSVVWSYAGINPATEIMLIDKGLIILLSFLVVFLSRISLSFIWCRRCVLFVVWLICMASVSDDIIVRSLSVSTTYITLTLLIAVGTFPFTGWQTLLLNLVILVTVILESHFIPSALGIQDVELQADQVIFLILIAIPLTGISSLIYINRFEQFRARHQAEELSKKLEERAHVLRSMKEKSEQQAEKILEHEKLKDQFFTNISHELRTPLTLILGPLEDLVSGRNEDVEMTTRPEMFKLMHKNGQQLLLLINQLLDLSKIDAGGIRLSLQYVDLSALIQEAVLSFSPMAERKRINLAYYVEQESIIARIDHDHMKRVMGNLISNALKFTPEGGKVNVSLSLTDTVDRSIRIRITDTGKGIPENDLSHVFDRFYQASDPYNSLNQGTGIGLALVKEIVQLHGGTVHVSSKLGSGSEFTIHLYDVLEASQKSESTKDGSSIKDLEDERKPEILGANDTGQEETENTPVVMLIDDNPDILTYLEPYLSSRYDVLLQESSTEALQIIKEQKVDLIISDIMMPEPDGFELCHIIKTDAKLNHIPVILLTARTGEEYRLEGLKLGADDYINKPFSAYELMARVENLIDLRRMLRSKFSEKIQLKGKKVEVSSADARFLKHVQSVIENNMENSNFGVEWLADEVCLSTRQLQRKMRTITDLSAAGYIRLLRLERASQLLLQQWGNISEVSYKVGFQDAKYFSRLFKQTFGETPTEYVEKKE